MSTERHLRRGTLTELSIDECWQLLSSRSVGRVAWATPNGPEVIPVNFTRHGSRIVLHTTAYASMVQRVDEERIAFQVDHLEEADRTGWSVLAQGRAQVQYGRSAESTSDTPPWPHGVHPVTVTIDVDKISGRRLVVVA